MESMTSNGVIQAQRTFISPISSVRGLTVIELMMVVTILGILAAIAIPAYDGYAKRARNSEAMIQLETIETYIQIFQQENFRIPDSLADIGMDTLEDPWGNTFVYVNFDNIVASGNGGNENYGKRKDKNLLPVNDDYDLCSMGANGTTNLAFTSAQGKDDIVRANNGAFIGVAEDY